MFYSDLINFCYKSCCSSTNPGPSFWNYYIPRCTIRSQRVLPNLYPFSHSILLALYLQPSPQYTTGNLKTSVVSDKKHIFSFLGVCSVIEAGLGFALWVRFRCTPQASHSPGTRGYLLEVASSLLEAQKVLLSITLTHQSSPVAPQCCQIKSELLSSAQKVLLSITLSNLISSHPPLTLHLRTSPSCAMGPQVSILLLLFTSFHHPQSSFLSIFIWKIHACALRSSSGITSVVSIWMPSGWLVLWHSLFSVVFSGFILMVFILFFPANKDSHHNPPRRSWNTVFGVSEYVWQKYIYLYVYNASIQQKFNIIFNYKHQAIVQYILFRVQCH